MELGINPGDFRELVIAPSLAVMGLGGDAAEELMLGTALQESHCGRRLRQVKGDALGPFQMEPATHHDVWSNFLSSRTQLAMSLHKLMVLGIEPLFQLEGNFYYGCAMARLVYLRVIEPLPKAGDLEAQAAFYKLHYNTAGGAATVGEYIANWRAAFHEGAST